MPQGDFMINASKVFNFDEAFESFLKHDQNSTAATLKNDIRQVYSQYPFCQNKSQSSCSDDFVERTYQDLKARIKDKLREKYQNQKETPDQVIFGNDILDACVDELVIDFCKQLKRIHTKI